MRKKILIIDDDELILTLLEARLSSLGHEIHLASTPGQGTKIATEIHPDLIILDIRMPEGNGWTVMHNLRKSKHLKDVPIIVSSAESSMKEMFLAEGVAGFLSKPYDPAHLIELVNGALS